MPLQIDAQALNLLPPSSTGIAIGIPSPLSPAVLLFVPTPPAPADTAAAAWGALHARHVTRLLPGGAAVLAAYDASSASSSLACAIAKEIGGEGTAFSSEFPRVVELGEKVLFAMCGEADACGRGDGAEIVEGLGEEVCVVSARVKVAMQADASGEMRAQDLRSAVGGLRIGGKVVLREDDSGAFGDLAKGSIGKGAVTQVRPLRKVGGGCGRAAKGEKPRNAWVAGEVSLCAVVLKSASLGDVLRVVRQDMSRSNEARLSLMSEYADEENGGEDGGGVGAPGDGFPFPARLVGMPVATGNQATSWLPICDYLGEGEDVDADVVPRVGELLSWEEGDGDLFRFEVVERISSGRQRSESEGAAEGKDGQVDYSPSQLEDSTRNGLACGIAAMAIVGAAAIAIKALQDIFY